MGTDLHKLLSESSAEKTMTIIDALLIEDVVQDAVVEHSHTKMRSSLNKLYNRTTGPSNGDGSSFDYDSMVPPEYEDVGEEGLAGIPVMG